MKIRNGFVSNSSSSSFVMFASEKVFDEALSQCTDMQREAVENYIENVGEFNGVKINKFSYFHSSEDDDENIYDVIDKYNPNRDGDDYAQVQELTEFVFEGGFDSLVEEKAKQLNENILSHQESLWKLD